MFQNKKLKQENEKIKKDNNEYRKIMTITRDLDLYKALIYVAKKLLQRRNRNTCKLFYTRIRTKNRIYRR